jgi:hypothetical protein
MHIISRLSHRNQNKLRLKHARKRGFDGTGWAAFYADCNLMDHRCRRLCDRGQIRAEPAVNAECANGKFHHNVVLELSLEKHFQPGAESSPALLGHHIVGLAGYLVEYVV